MVDNRGHNLEFKIYPFWYTFTQLPSRNVFAVSDWPDREHFASVTVHSKFKTMYVKNVTNLTKHLYIRSINNLMEAKTGASRVIYLTVSKPQVGQLRNCGSIPRRGNTFSSLKRPYWL
jgi:hypothetical protein